MNTLQTLVHAYIENSLSTDDYAEQFINFWNEVRIEQNKAIDEANIRQDLDNLWQQYRSGELDEVTYGMQWTEVLNQLTSIEIPPQSIIYTMGNEVYSLLVMYKESEHLEDQDIPTQGTIKEHSKNLLDALDN